MRGLCQEVWHHHTSKKHLPRYLTEFDYKFNRRELTGGQRMVATLRNAEGKRLTLYKGARGRPSLRGRRGATGRRISPWERERRMLRKAERVEREKARAEAERREQAGERVKRLEDLE